MADGGTPLEQQVADAQALAAQLPDLQRGAAAAEAALGAADLGLDRARSAWDAAHDAAVSARLPHLRAWGALLTGRYRRSRDDAAAAEESAAAGVATARQTLQRCQAVRDNTAARTSTALVAVGALPGLRETLRLEQLRAQGDPVVARVDVVDADLARVEHRLRELGEAEVALARAVDAVRSASRTLASAKSWGTYDTFFGGDLISSLVKHDRIDDSNHDLRQVSDALAAARRELADVDADLSADPLVVESCLKTTDIWFDNFFSDLSVQGRITDHIATIDRLGGRLAELRRHVDARTRASTDERDLLRRRRAELLGT